MKEIQLTDGKVALVDDADLEMLSVYTWWAQPGSKTHYACAQIAGCTAPLRMHRLLLNVNNPRIQVDHADRNGLNNQRSNLRIVTVAQNAQNRKLPITNTSGFKGIVWMKRSQKWAAQVRITENGKQRMAYFRRFPTRVEAAMAYDLKAVEIYGPYAATNQMLGLL